MVPYIDNTPFVNSLIGKNPQKGDDNSLLIIFSGIIIVSGIIVICYAQQKQFSNIIANLQYENERLKRKQNI